MAFKAIVFMIASFLLLTSKVSSNVEESHLQATFAKPPVKTPTLAPVQAPAPAPYSRVLPPVSISECPRLCKVRCSLHSNLDRCMRACTTCCQRCRCVPPGTSGNREMCGKTYVEMTTHGGRPKCP